MCTHAEELNDWIRVFKIITNASRYKCSHYAYIIHIFFKLWILKIAILNWKIKHLLEGNIIKKSNVFSSKSLCRVLWISREFVKTKSAEEPSATSHIQMSVSYDIMCVIWSPSIALVPCACRRSDINGCAVKRAANDDIFLIWHHLHLVLRGCSTSEYLCSVLRHVLECLRAIFSSSINRGWIKAFTNKNDQWQQTLISLFLPELTASVQYIFSLFVHTAALNQCQNATGKYSLPFF